MRSAGLLHFSYPLSTHDYLCLLSCTSNVLVRKSLQNAVPAEGNGDLQALISCVLAERPRRYPTLLNPVP